MLANKLDKKIGIYVLEFEYNLADSRPDTEEVFEYFRFITKWPNKLNIDDANLTVLERIVTEDKEEKVVKELVISFKKIHENTLCIIIFSLETMSVVYNFETI
jgi:hypothetical protein